MKVWDHDVLEEERKRIRAKMKKLRKSLDQEEVRRRSERVLERVMRLERYSTARVLASYIGRGGEVETLPLIDRALQEGKEVLVPVVMEKSDRLLFSQLLNPRIELEMGPFSIPQPKKDALRPRPLHHAQLVLVPGLAFDEEGHRLGHGFGYYDRALRDLDKRIMKVGLAFDFQIVKHLPFGPWDVPMNAIITESRTILVEGS